MDLLKKVLVITFYVLIVIVGIVGFIAIRSLQGEREPIQPDSIESKQNIVNS